MKKINWIHVPITRLLCTVPHAIAALEGGNFTPIVLSLQDQSVSNAAGFGTDSTV